MSSEVEIEINVVTRITSFAFFRKQHNKNSYNETKMCFFFFSGEFAKKAVCFTYLRLTMYNLYWFLCFLWSTLLRAATAFYRFDCCLTCALSIHEDQLFFVRFEWEPFSALFFSRRDVAIHRDSDVHNSSQASAWMVHCSSKIFNAIFFTLRECLRMLECDWEWLALLKFTQTDHQMC